MKEFHPKGITQAYTDMRSYLESMGFEHRQGSGYVSKNAMNYATVNAIVRKMSNEYDWLSKCIKEIDVTDVGEKYYSLLDTVCGKESIVKDILEEKDEMDLDIDITDDFDDY